MQYAILEADTVHDLEREVEEALANGAEVAGGIAVIKHDQGEASNTFYQAVIYDE